MSNAQLEIDERTNLTNNKFELLLWGCGQNLGLLWR